MRTIFVLIMISMVSVFSGCAYISGMKEDNKPENKINTQAGAEAEKRNSAPDEKPKTTTPAAASAHNNKNAASTSQANQTATGQENTVLTAIQRKALRALTMPLPSPQDNMPNTQSPAQPAATIPSSSPPAPPGAGTQPTSVSPSAEAKPGFLRRAEMLSQIQSLSKLLDMTM